ncbi:MULTISPECIES: tetratricopeptide repeat protein [Legionella]|uniref:Tetratricopeptide repeat protein n=1 Tax=Legionella septentrionalis TaxID=2498109 RepID=A0A433JHG0_9GAMM|nr:MULTISPECIES: tetratricopeptide repeat protein [Legionella]MCP0914673.1 tetratricopeptide repeat protein [Legionella sp. 27cVA30]RUQ81611.1 tetratricopeptide repeat protein [Legionella septentrionalis]RUQ95743.1 tetratricopeptide repeat protein [Legionella septentrionalis]RUR09143.1 tetratricopeptide repeat protein [Legionella septentrionalis]
MSEWASIFSLSILLITALGIALYPLRPYKKLKTMLVPVLSVAAVFAYYHWGSWFELQDYKQQIIKQQQAQALLSKIRSPQELIAKLKAKLDENPSGARGWYLLGRLYASQGQWKDARESFAQAFALEPNDEQITVNYAQSLWQENQRHFNEPIRGLVNRLLQINPNQPDALAMLAMNAFMSHDYPLAIRYWRQLLTVVPPDSDDAKAIKQAIAKAEQAAQAT